MHVDIRVIVPEHFYKESSPSKQINGRKTHGASFRQAPFLNFLGFSLWAIANHDLVRGTQNHAESRTHLTTQRGGSLPAEWIYTRPAAFSWLCHGRPRNAQHDISIVSPISFNSHVKRTFSKRTGGTWKCILASQLCAQLKFHSIYV